MDLKLDLPSLSYAVVARELLSSLDAPSGSGIVVARSQDVVPGAIFIALTGTAVDGHQFIPDAVAKGAGLLIVERDVSTALPANHPPFIVVTNTRAAWAQLMSKAFDHPERDLKLIGITGTNGKTSTVSLVRSMLEHAGVPSVGIGTLGIFVPGFDPLAATHTTPDPDRLFAIFAMARLLGIKHVVMEVSSHSIVQQRIAPLQFEAGVFTSFSRDHLDFHKDMESYLQAKCQLFTEHLKNTSIAIIHADVLAKMPPNVATSLKGTVRTYAAARLGLEADCEIQNQLHGTGQDVTVMLKGISDADAKGAHGWVPFLGTHTAENFLAAYLVTGHLTGHYPAPNTWTALAQIPGRLETVSQKPHVLVDYAHTPDALEKALAEIKAWQTPAQKLWVVFGCGGDRDTGKRPLMAAVAERLADHIIVTSDNPRFEKPTDIIENILGGFRSQVAVRVEPDRKLAIEIALAQAAPHDTIVIAGKGHENYQEIAGVRHHFSDQEAVRQYFKQA